MIIGSVDKTAETQEKFILRKVFCNSIMYIFVIKAGKKDKGEVWKKRTISKNIY